MNNNVLGDLQRHIVRSFIDTIILSEIRKANYLGGYTLMELVLQKFGFLMSAGTIYAHLYSLERKDLIKAAPSEETKKYVLTEKGTKTIELIIESKGYIITFFETVF